jgi:hypothetical protein
MKLHDLAPEFNLKSPEFMKLLGELGFPYTSFAQNVNDDEAEVIRAEVSKHQAGDTTRAKIRELSKMAMIGMYYDYHTGKYKIAKLYVYPSEFEKLGIILSKGYPTIDHATQDLNLETIDAGFYAPGELEKFRRKNKK